MYLEPLGPRARRVRVTATVGSKPPSGLRTHALLDFRMGVSLDGDPLTGAQIQELLTGERVFEPARKGGGSSKESPATANSEWPRGVSASDAMRVSGETSPAG
jgi:hypothetical protein